MRRLLTAFFTALLLTVGGGCAFAQSHVVRDIDITVNLAQDGSARIREIWNVCVDTGSEWYLVRYNLGDIAIRDLTVSENGEQFITEDDWDIHRSMEEKAGRCGIVRVSDHDGCEICWGLGSYGNHIFTVEYTMTNVVKSMDDYDCLHVQFVSPGINPYPQHARVEVHADSLLFDGTRTAIWAFGFDGTCDFMDGAIVANTEAPFGSDRESVILLARFDKGMFSPESSISATFEQKLEKAFEDSDYKAFQEQERRKNWGIAGFFVAFVLFVTGTVLTSVRQRNKNMFGVVKLKEIGYRREVPFGGDIFQSRYVLAKCGRLGSEANTASALILKMIKDGQLLVSNAADGKVLIGFNPNADLSALNDSEKEFHDMLYEASGEDHILQEKEFSRWSSRMSNSKRVGRWVTGLTGEAVALLQRNRYVDSKAFTLAGKQQAQNVVGFRNFLNDFTLSKERKSAEVALWQDYLIFASLYGIAKKVAKEMKDIDPKAFQECFGYEFASMNRVLLISNNMGGSIVNSVARVQSRSSVSGHGGTASFGGGGGFSGGGFGGGAR